MKLSGRRVLLTGASRGIGAELAKAFAGKGADVALVARPSDDLKKVASNTGGTAYPCDLGELDSLPDLVEKVEADGPVDVLVNNAGVAHVGWFLDRTQDEIDQLVAVNLLAPIRLCHLLLPKMVERDRGQVVVLSSMAAVFAPPGLAAYSASKAGLSHFMAGLRADLRDHPITFTTVTLASVKTEMEDEARSYGPLKFLDEKAKGRGITPMDVFIKAVLTGIENDDPEVRVPKAMAPLAMLTNTPRKLGRLMFGRAPAYEMRSR